MTHAEIITPHGTRKIAFEPTNFGAPYQKLFDQTDVSGYEEWLLESHNNFRNPFAQASRRRHEEMGGWCVIHRDKIYWQGAMVDDKGRRHVTYVSHDNTEWQKEHDVWVPDEGWYVPTQDGVFHEGTLVPFETIDSIERPPKERWEKAGLDPDYISYFLILHPHEHEDEYSFAGRVFDPDPNCDVGRFAINVTSSPFDSNPDNVASRPKYEVAMQITHLPKREEK